MTLKYIPPFQPQYLSFLRTKISSSFIWIIQVWDIFRFIILVDCFYQKFALFYFCFFTFYSHIPNVLCHIPNVLSYSKSSIICNWLFVHNKTKINKLIIGTFNFKQELLTTIPQVQSYSKCSMSCNRFFVQNKTKINKLIIGTFDNNRNI